MILHKKEPELQISPKELERQFRYFANEFDLNYRSTHNFDKAVEWALDRVMPQLIRKYQQEKP